MSLPVLVCLLSYIVNTLGRTYAKFGRFRSNSRKPLNWNEVANELSTANFKTFESSFYTYSDHL